MLRFVDISKAYAVDVEAAAPLCMIVDTVTDKALENDQGHHVFDGLIDVDEAGGRRATRLVPDGFFPGERIGRDYVECTVCRLRKPPIGRSVPMEMANGMCCPHDCPGYQLEPRPDTLWPGEVYAP